jgi:hypothetical protein
VGSGKGQAEENIWPPGSIKRFDRDLSRDIPRVFNGPGQLEETQVREYSIAALALAVPRVEGQGHT